MAESARAVDFLNRPRRDGRISPTASAHCDIKPQNILIVGGSARVCNFGLVRGLGAATWRTTGSRSISPAYASFELVAGALPTQTSDQYSLAISYVHLRTGALPFDSTNLHTILTAHLDRTLNLSRLSPSEQRVIRRATSPDAAKRNPTCLDMVEDLRQVTGGKAPMPSGSTPSLGRTFFPRARDPWALRCPALAQKGSGRRLWRTSHSRWISENWPKMQARTHWNPS
jgi:serine/threonine protein kinase